MAAAVSNGTASGTTATSVAAATNPLRPRGQARSGSEQVITRSPTARSATAQPVPAATAAASTPSAMGGCRPRPHSSPPAAAQPPAAPNRAQLTRLRQFRGSTGAESRRIPTARMPVPRGRRRHHDCAPLMPHPAHRRTEPVHRSPAESGTAQGCAAGQQPPPAAPGPDLPQRPEPLAGR